MLFSLIIGFRKPPSRHPCMGRNPACKIVMKSKVNEISLPTEVKHGRIDLTESRNAAELPSMTAKEKAILEDGLASAIKDAVSTDAQIKAHEAALKEKLQELKRNRKALSGAKAKDSATDKNQGNAKAATA